MIKRKNPLKLNKLQARTLVLAQILAREPDSGFVDEMTGDVTLVRRPHAHGDHVHIGPYVVSAKDASGFNNPAVWVALARKGLSRPPDAGALIVTKAGLSYDTGLGDAFTALSDH